MIITLRLAGIVNTVLRMQIFQEIFDEIVLLAMNHKMVGGRVLFTDSTHLKANANKHKFSKVRKSVLQYFRLIGLPVDWSGGHSTPAGYRGHWRPRRRQSAEEAPGPPRGKRVPGAEINRPICKDHQ